MVMAKRQKLEFFKREVGALVGNRQA